MPDELELARRLLDGVVDAETDAERAEAIRAAQAHALLSIAGSMRQLVEALRPSTEHRAPSTERIVAPCWSPEEAAILKDTSAPKGYVCPVCTHGLVSHRMHGCDAAGCDCRQPFGRIPPGDPDPTDG